MRSQIGIGLRASTGLSMMVPAPYRTRRNGLTHPVSDIITSSAFAAVSAAYFHPGGRGVGSGCSVGQPFLLRGADHPQHPFRSAGSTFTCRRVRAPARLLLGLPTSYGGRESIVTENLRDRPV